MIENLNPINWLKEINYARLKKINLLRWNAFNY